MCLLEQTSASPVAGIEVMHICLDQDGHDRTDENFPPCLHSDTNRQDGVRVSDLLSIELPTLSPSDRSSGRKVVTGSNTSRAAHGWGAPVDTHVDDLLDR